MKASIRAAFALALATAAGTTVSAAFAQTPVPPSQLAKPAGSAPTISIPGVSAAGIATLNKLQQQRDPVLIQLAQQQRAVSQQIVATIAGATVDVDKFAALLKQSEGLSAQVRVRADDHVLQALRALPPGDRAPFLRGVVGASQKR